MANAVRLEGISKSFGAVRALQNVSLTVEPQTMHAIVGENGAGKTTLMRVLYGVIRPDEGSVEIDGKAVTLRSSSEAADHGIGMVSQHYGIIPELTCLQNLILGSERSLALDLKKLRKEAQALAEQMDFSFDWDEDASTLSPAFKQKLEILKLLWRNSKVMILDEPTAMLSPADADSLFESMHGLIGKGATVILVTHRLPEVMEYCRRVSVMRGGKLVAESEVSQTDPPTLAGLIMGTGPKNIEERPIPRLVAESEKPALRLTNATVKGERGHDALSDISFAIRPGEIVGIAGVDGNGQSELVEAIAGILPLDRGHVELLDGLGEDSTTFERLRHGLRLVPEDRHDQGVIEGWSLETNAALGLESLSPLAKGPWIDAGERKSFAKRVLERFDTRNGGMDKPIASLSGGNQQRLVVARSLELGTRLLVAFQPVRGLDLGATARIYTAIREACDQGMGALIVSFDLDELLAHCDRILVLNGGRIFVPENGKSLDREAIGKLMVGVQ